MDNSQKIEPDERECRSEEEENSWRQGKQEDKKRRRSETQATTITIHLLMTPNTINDKTQREGKREIEQERRDLGVKEGVERGGVEGHQRNETEMKGGEKEKEQRSIGTQTTLSLERQLDECERSGEEKMQGVEGHQMNGRENQNETHQSEAETSEGRQTAALSIQSLPPEILISIFNYVPDVKTRFSLRRLCSEFRNLIDARVCWKSSDELRIVVRGRGMWYSINGVRVNGSHIYFGLFHSFKRTKENVCEGIRAMFNRINIKRIIICGVDYLTDEDILLTLGEQILKHESSDRPLRSVRLFGERRLSQPLLFSIFVPVATALEHLYLNLWSIKPKISKGAEESAYRLIKCCTKLEYFRLWPIFSVRCLEAIRGRTIKGLNLHGGENEAEDVERICNSLTGTLGSLHLFGPLANIFFNLNNNQQLHTIAAGCFSRGIDGANNVIIRELATFPNIRHILFLFSDGISGECLVLMVTTMFNAFQQQDRARNRTERHVVFRVEDQIAHKKDVNWPQESVKQALEEEQIEVCATTIRPITRPITRPYGWWSPRPPFKWLELRRENVSISLYCDCISK